MSGTASLDRVTKLLSAFQESATTTFETMVFLPVLAGTPESKNKGGPTGYISGTISLASDDQSGTLSLIFPMDLAKAIFRSMMGMQDADAVAEGEVHDVVGELANMVAGGAKSRLQDIGFNFKIGLPTVVVGENHYLEPPRNVQTMVMPMNTSKGMFYLELSF
ncbi:MAG: chemotaxis protein CheX [Lentisphaerota bacterium]